MYIPKHLSWMLLDHGDKFMKANVSMSGRRFLVAIAIIRLT